MSPISSPLTAFRVWFEANNFRNFAWLCGLVLVLLYSGMRAEEMAFDIVFG
jgi:hypothetical protein